MADSPYAYRSIGGRVDSDTQRFAESLERSLVSDETEFPSKRIVKVVVYKSTPVVTGS